MGFRTLTTNQNQWQKNLSNVAGYVQNGGNTAQQKKLKTNFSANSSPASNQQQQTGVRRNSQGFFLKYKPTSTNTQQQISPQIDQNAFVDYAPPQVDPNKTREDVENDWIKQHTNQQQPTETQSYLQQLAGQLTSGDNTQFQKIFQALQQQQQQTQQQQQQQLQQISQQMNTYGDPTYEYRLKEQQLLNDPNTRAQAQQLWNNSSMTQPVQNASVRASQAPVSQNVQNGGNPLIGVKRNPQGFILKHKSPLPLIQQQPINQQPVSSTPKDREQGIMSDPIGPTNTGNSNYNGSNTNQQAPVSQNDFIDWHDNTATFNPTMATTQQAPYTRMEGAYGDANTSRINQNDYVGQVASLGQVDANGNWINNLWKLAQEITPYGQSQNIDNANINTDKTLEKMAGSTEATAPDYAGYEARNTKEGYTTDDLKKFYENGMDILQEAYGNSLDKASADFNRLGLRGSGFELADKYGSQSDSITSGFAKNAQQLATDIYTKGLEAEREDRYRNLDTNDKNRLDWSNYFTNLGQQGFSNLAQLAGLQQQFANGLNSNNLDWSKYYTDVDLKNKDALTNAIKLYQDIARQGDSSFIDWARVNGGLAQNDENNIQTRWKNSFDIWDKNAGYQNELLKTFLVTLATGATGSNENYKNLIGQFGNIQDYMKSLLTSAGFNFNR